MASKFIIQLLDTYQTPGLFPIKNAILVLFEVLDTQKCQKCNTHEKKSSSLLKKLNQNEIEFVVIHLLIEHVDFVDDQCHQVRLLYTLD